MRTILYKKRHSMKYRRKVIAINELSEDQDCKTHVRKSFVYKVSRVEHVEKALGKPEVYIVKRFDKKLQQERFNFRVKGAFYMTNERSIFQVNFCHTLKINLYWKNKNFSPKKSVTLT